MAEYRLSPAAEYDMESIWLYSRDTWGLAQAERYVAALAEAFDSLAQSPLTAAACDNIRPGYRRFRVGRHMIYFRVTAYGIAIIRILHARMDAPRHL